MKFNEKLKYLREKKNFTQEEIALKLNIARQSVSKWENGINEPDIETLKKLCQILDCSISDLIDDNQEVISSKEEKRTKLVNKLFMWNIAIFIASVMLFFVFFRGMSEEIIIHWDNSFKPTYGHKSGALVSLLPLTLGFLLAVFLRFWSIKSKYYQVYRLHNQIFALSIQLFLTIICFVMISFMDKNMGDNIEIIVFGFALSLIFVISIATYPKLNKRNPFFGLKTSFTLSSEEAWNRVHAPLSYIMGTLGIASYIFLLISYNPKHVMILFIVLVVIMIISFITVHEVVRAKIKREKDSN